MASKVIFLAYTNSETRPLPTLGKESRDVYSVLTKDYIKGYYIIHRDQFATPETTNDALKEFEKNIVVFNYSGHAARDSIFWGDRRVLSDGLAYQLESSIHSGSLKLVVLNGCSTAGQTKVLLKLGVPAVIATHSPVNDFAACEFAIRFFHNLSEERLSIKEAYYKAVAQAQNITEQNLEVGNQEVRGLGELEGMEDNRPVWGMFCNDINALEINPLPNNIPGSNSSFVVNKLLRKQLFETLSEAGNEEIHELKEKELKNKLVESADKDAAIVNVLPMPIGEQLRKLLCPTDVYMDEEGYDKINLRRIEQICRVFHTTIELLGCIMLAQLWEEKLKPQEQQPPELHALPMKLIEMLKAHFYLSSEQRSVFNYLPFIRTIRQYFDSLNNGQGIKYFIDELRELKDIAKEDSKFITAYQYLTNIRNQAARQQIVEAEIPNICVRAEEKLSDFFSYMGFLHRYSLTSIQNISILKYRHSRSAKFNHSVLKLMRVGGSEKFIYQCNNYMDNQGVVLLKGTIHLIDSETKQFVIDDDLEFLNLSPFIIETSAFEANATKAKLSLYDQYIRSSNVYRFKSFLRPNDPRDSIEVGTDQKYKSIKEELDDYRKNILKERN